MRKKYFNNHWFWAIAVSAVSISFFLLFVGSYFEEYEALVNQFMSGFISNRPYDAWATDMDFLLLPIYSRLQDILPFQVYSTAKVLWLGLAIVILTYSIVHYVGRNLTEQILLTVLIILIISENIFLINNVRISFLLCFSGYLLLILNKNSDNKNYIIGVLAILLSCFNRVEIPIVLGLLFLSYFLLFESRNRIGLTVLTFSMSVAVILSFYFLMEKENPHIKNFQYHERALFDNQDFLLEDAWYNTSSLDSAQLVLVGKLLLMYDENIITHDGYKELLKHPSKLDYIFHNEEFLNIYSKKLNEVWLFLLNDYLWILGILLFLVLYNLITLYRQKRLLFIKASIVTVIYISIPLLITMLSMMPRRFISPYLSLGVIALLVVNFHTEHRVNLKWLQGQLYIFLLIGLFCNTSYLRTQQKFFRSRIEATDQLKQCIDQKENLFKDSAVFASMDFNKLFHGRLFEKYYQHRMVFVEAYAYNYYSHVYNFNQDYFEEAHSSLKKRYQFLADNEVSIFSDTYYISFIKNYLEKVHKKDFEFIPLGNCDLKELIEYKFNP